MAKENINDHKRGQFAGMTVNIFSTRGVNMPDRDHAFHRIIL
jgi:hypothetical protein